MQLRHVSPWLDDAGVPDCKVWHSSARGGYLFTYRDGYCFVVEQSGSAIWVSWPEHLSLADAALYLLGPILGFVVRLRGYVSLHAGAVAVDDFAIALVGPSGGGKSTTAAALAMRGFPLLSEDLVALSETDDGVIVHPGPQRVRLCADAVEHLCGSMDALPLVSPTSDKHALDVAALGFRTQRDPLPLGAVYLLSDRSPDSAAPFIEHVASDRSLMYQLVGNTFSSYLLDGKMRAREFDMLGRLATEFPVRRAIPHVSPDRIPMLCDAIVSDFLELRAQRQ